MISSMISIMIIISIISIIIVSISIKQGSSRTFGLPSIELEVEPEESVNARVDKN